MGTRKGSLPPAGSKTRPGLIPWLLEGDPAVRWQVLQDLAGAPAADVSAERRRIANEGWGARLLGEQDDGGTWAQGLYLPKWTSTTYTLLLLHRLGLPEDNPQAVRGCHCLWDGATYFGGGPSLWQGPPDTCVAGMLVLLGSYFRYGEPRLDAAVSYRSHRTGVIAKENFTRFPFPPQWHFDILRGLEYFRASGAARDPRLEDALEGIREARNPDGRWKRPPPYSGRQWFTLEPPGASRITTLRCLRVLRWWDSSNGAA